MARRKPCGVLGLFERPETVLVAARRVRDAGYQKWDVHTPFPVHGMDEAMGLGRSRVPWITFVAGLVGLATALFILFGTMVYSWPGNFGGKPHAAWPSFVPIAFEMTVLVAGVSTALGALLLGGVFARAVRTLFRAEPMALHPDLTSHRFAIFVAAEDPAFDGPDLVQRFEHLGACEVRVLGEDDSPARADSEAEPLAVKAEASGADSEAAVESEPAPRAEPEDAPDVGLEGDSKPESKREPEAAAGEPSAPTDPEDEQ